MVAKASVRFSGDKRIFAILCAGLLLLPVGLTVAPDAEAGGFTCFGRAVTILGNGRAQKINGTPGDDVIYGRGGRDIIKGKGGNDFLCGGGANDKVVGGPGEDNLAGDGGADLLKDGVVTPLGVDNNFASMLGGPGNDTLRGRPETLEGAVFLDAGGGVNANLSTGVATGLGIGRDTLIDIDDLEGSNFDDVLVGNDSVSPLDGLGNFIFGADGNDQILGLGGDDRMFPGPGNDTTDGGTGLADLVGFGSAIAPVSASLASGSATGDGNDTFSNVEAFGDSPLADNLTGNDANNAFFVTLGNDTVNGAGGTDLVCYCDEQLAVFVNLKSGTATGQGADALMALEDAIGSILNDTIVGTDGPNFLFGNDGNDELFGEGAEDELVGGNGIDTADGGPATDTCESENKTSCELEFPPARSMASKVVRAGSLYGVRALR
ncbi:MAG: calcium-binding protein [Actinomycetota bacterium]